MEQYVIIGNGIAAAGCIEGIRSINTEAKIVVISKEKHPVYCRPLISYYLEGKTDLDKISYRDKDFYKKNNCEVIYGEVAEKIDSKNKTVILSNGEKIEYSKLCISTGSSAFVPPIDGLETVENKFSFLTLDDALSLEKALTKNSKVLIIGAGLIGLKCAEGIKESVKSVTVCDLAENVLSSILDEESAPFVKEHLERKGLNLLLGDSAIKFSGNTAIMKSGKTVDFDVLVTAVGVRANTGLAESIGAKVNRGIVVNENQKTSISGIYAAGDCTESFDITQNTHRVLALLPNAYIGGFTAGVNMLGGKRMFDNAIPMNSIGFFGLHIMTAGSYFPEKDGGAVSTVKTEKGFKKFFVKDNKLVGYILVGDIEKGGIYTDLIRKQTPLDTLDFDLIKEHPTFTAFSEKIRKEKFGGVV